jgi:hypothetical protein
VLRDRRTHLGEHTPFFRCNVGPFGGIVGDVIQLYARRLDEVMARVDERPQPAPSEVDPRQHRLAVDTPRARRRKERSTRERSVRRCSGERSDRRRHVDELHRLRDRLAASLRAGQLHDERHAQHFAVEEHAVLAFSMIAEAFAVIGEQHDDGAVIHAERLQSLDELPDRCIRRRNFTVVRVREA